MKSLNKWQRIQQSAWSVWFETALICCLMRYQMDKTAICSFFVSKRPDIANRLSLTQSKGQQLLFCSHIYCFVTSTWWVWWPLFLSWTFIVITLVYSNLKWPVQHVCGRIGNLTPLHLLERSTLVNILRIWNLVQMLVQYDWGRPDNKFIQLLTRALLCFEMHC